MGLVRLWHKDGDKAKKEMSTHSGNCELDTKDGRYIIFCKCGEESTKDTTTPATVTDDVLGRVKEITIQNTKLEEIMLKQKEKESTPVVSPHK